jgi:serine/threonine-protein kinase
MGLIGFILGPLIYIGPVTDFGVTTENIVYLVMELVEGQSLRNLMREEKQMNYLRAVNIVRQICGAVEAAHQSGVIHRDLKPENILVIPAQGTECVKVLDFGIAKLRETKTDAFLTQAGMIIGTPQYMSPEQCQGKELDHRSDIYSIGILLYEMLSGVVPFDAESTLEVVYNQLHQPPRPLTELSPHVPAALARVVLRALEKEPGKRQSSALQLSDELKLAVESPSEEEFLSRYPLLNRPYERKADSGASLDENSDSLRTTPFTERAFTPGRETSEISRLNAEGDIFRTQTGPGQPVAAGAQRSPATRSENLQRGRATTGRGSRKGLIGFIALALIAPAAIAVYLGLRTAAPPAPAPKIPTAPEGMVYIPGGKFTMGRNDGSPDEGPAHEVVVEPYFLDRHEVTNQEYRKFIDATGRKAPKHWKLSGSYPLEEASYPVTHVTWEDAMSYAKWANKRLPTEAEWEYAARGGDREYLYPWGNQWQPGNANVDRKGPARPAPVGSFDRDVSPFGVYDMAGNVSEWVQDYYSENYGARPDLQFRVYRGGNFLDPPEKSTATFRWADFPVAIPDDQILRVGFRCARNIQ